MTPSTHVQNRLTELAQFGQSVWLDNIRRDLLTTGALKRMVEQDGLGGVTSNPAIFEKAIVGSNEYSDFLAELQADKNLDAKAIYEHIAIRDIQDAADVLRVVYDRTNRRDGYVSLEVSPFLALETKATIEEARRLWKAVNRPNLMIKIPGTSAGLPAIETAISEGINVNVTLLFSQDVYEDVANAYIRGLEKCADPSHVASVASFFVSRIDTAVEGYIKGNPALQSLSGKVAIANAKLAYQRYLRIFSGPKWEPLEARGAMTQRVLWASTSTKIATMRDVVYVEELIGPDTVNTIPPATLDAFRDHGEVRASLESGIEEAKEVMAKLEGAGVSIDKITSDLVTQGVKLFAEPFDKLLNTVDPKCKLPLAAVNPMTYMLGHEEAEAVQAGIEAWFTGGKTRRLWARDASLWTGTDEDKWLGWLNIVDVQLAQKEQFKQIAQDIKAAGFTDALLLGMGGSSLCVEVLKLSFGDQPGFPKMHVLDSTDPDQIRAIESQIDVKKTLFIVSSKSGSTLEPNIFKQYFYERNGRDGSHFFAITDPGSKMQQVAQADHFRGIFYGLPSIGGRYSALSDFGMVPGAVMGIDTTKFLEGAAAMELACSPCSPVEKNPGVLLGILLGTLAKAGRDKVTIAASPGIHDLGAWLEQLLAESTGKEGKGLVPVDREQLGAPEVYGKDRVFVYARLESGADPAQDRAVEALEKAGQPVIRITLKSPYDLGQEFFRWEVATAVAGSIIGINAFNQPDVEASKIATKKLTTEFEEKGSLPAEKPVLVEDGLSLFALKTPKSLDAALLEQLNSLKNGDYFALLAYIQMNEEHEAALQAIRTSVRNQKRVATCLGFGPRFLHSTGQAYKGGPNTGVFLQLTSDATEDLQVPGQKYTFGIVKLAQARGDLQVLQERGRRAMRIHLGSDVRGGLAKLGAAMARVLG
ncbi:MAG TPA: bifunctional transaldolase/phosoglucose isomerase [Bryobacteraceae bacterium]|jgi:transaldolase/glucose-6-phosphate isomerase|nr:bifunctional transaldolase/phosoglucose isomerase [Bryobacteraceae bacterium]